MSKYAFLDDICFYQQFVHTSIIPIHTSITPNAECLRNDHIPRGAVNWRLVMIRICINKHDYDRVHEGV